MGNLIITVIAIALVVLAAFIGTYYGGAAFLAANARAQANTIVDQGQQIASAWTMRAGDAQKDFDSAVNSGGSATYGKPFDVTSPNGLVPGYLLQLPVPPDTASLSAYSAANLTDSTSTSTYNGIILPLTTSSSGVNVCKEIAKQANIANSPRELVSTTDHNPQGDQVFDCLYHDVNANGGIDESDNNFRFVYRAR